MKKLIFAAGVGGLLAIKLIPVQRTARHLNKNSDDSSTTSTTSSSNKVVLDQLQSVKKVLAHSEVLRGELNELVAEFSVTESNRRKLGIYNRAQTLVATFLERYDNGDLTRGCANKEDCIISGNSAYSIELRDQIRLAFEKESNHYLELMDGVIQHGWNFIQDKDSSSSSKAKPEPTLSASAASFKSRDDVKAVFSSWREKSEKSKKIETSKKSNQFYAFYSIIGFVLAAAMAGWVGYVWYVSRYGCQTAKSLIRKRQLQRRQFLDKAIRIAAHWGTLVRKMSLDLISFILFISELAFIAVCEFRAFIVTHVSKRGIFFTSTSAAMKKATARVVPRKKRLSGSKAVDSLSFRTELDQTCSTMVESNCTSENQCSTTTLPTTSECVVVASPAVDVVPDASKRVENGFEASSMFVIQSECYDDRGTSPISVVRRPSIEDEVDKSDPGLTSASYEDPVHTHGTSSDDEGWTVLESTQSARVRGAARKKASVEADQNQSRGRVKESRSRRSAPKQLVIRPSRASPSLVSSASPSPVLTPTVPVPSFFNGKKDFPKSSTVQHAATVSGDSTDQESVEEHESRGVATEATTDFSVMIPDSSVSSASEMSNVHNDVNHMSELSTSPPPEPLYVPSSLSGAYYMVPQMLPAGMPWPPGAAGPYLPSMNMNMQYCYGPPPSPYGMFPGVEAYVVDGMQLSPGSPVTAVAGAPIFPSPVVMMDDRLTEAIRNQVEYYFSVENLCRDVYLRGKMDSQGFVLLEEIIQFNRIRHLQAPLPIVLRAIESSSHLEVLQPWAAKVSVGQVSDRAILDTKIRCSIGWERWILASASTGNKVELQP